MAAEFAAKSPTVGHFVVHLAADHAHALVERAAHEGGVIRIDRDEFALLVTVLEFDFVATDIHFRDIAGIDG